MNQQQFRITGPCYDFGVLQRTLGDIREICGNEDSFERNGDGIHGSHKCLSCRSVEWPPPVCFERLYY